MDNLTTIISKNIINVDIDSRIVTLPVNFNLGVTYDNACKTVTFMVQKKSDITDLTDLTFSVNTISAKGTPDKIDCDCIEEGGFYIITAVLKGTIFEASGKATFNLCGQKFDSSHVAVKSWGSEDITALVGSHSHADKAIEELYPSILEELKQKVNNPNLTDEQLDNIATKIADKGFYTKSEIDSMIAGIVVPTRLSQLEDDTTHRTVSDTEKANWNNKSDFDGSYNSLTNKPTIPNRLSQLTDDSMHRLVTDAEKQKWNSNTGGTGTSITVDSALSSTSVNPVQNKIIKAELDKKLNKSDVATSFNINTVTSDNPISTKAVYELVRNSIPNMEFSLVGKTDDVTKNHIVLLSDNCTEVIIIGVDLEATGNGKVEIEIDRRDDNNTTIVHGISNGVTDTVRSTYIAELKVVGFGVLAKIRSGQNEISQNSETYISYIPMDHMDINEISFNVGDMENGVSPVSGKFIIYGR